MSTMEKKRNNLQQEMFRLGIERKRSRRRSVKHGNKQFQKAEAAFSQKVLLNILDKGGSGIEWGQPILSWARRRLPGFLLPLFSQNAPRAA